jgi:serine/threonine-protein kinase RsbW
MSVRWSSQLVLQARVQELERLSGWLAELSESHQLRPRLASHMDLCLTEIVTNTITHGYARITAPEAAIIVRFARQDEQVVCRIEDRGVAFNPLAHPPAPQPKSLDDAQIGGSGLRLVRQFAKQLDYRHEGGSNKLTITFSA